MKINGNRLKILLIANPINNDNLLKVTGFPLLLTTYLLRTKERLWFDPILKEQYFPNDIDRQSVNNDPENLLREKIICKNFSGQIAEFLYAFIFSTSRNAKHDNLIDIYTRFKNKYPNSSYLPYIEPQISIIKEKKKNQLNDKMLIIANTDSLQTFKDVLNISIGKTVLLDMWGTWCAPCLKEISHNTDSIKNYFKGKELDYLYIANHDLDNEVKWKELIAYYNLAGTHILANKKLTRDIMTKVKGIGFPTYVIIKKDGTFVLSSAGYPMKLDILFNQIDEILNE